MVTAKVRPARPTFGRIFRPVFPAFSPIVGIAERVRVLNFQYHQD